MLLNLCGVIFNTYYVSTACVSNLIPFKVLTCSFIFNNLIFLDPLKLNFIMVMNITVIAKSLTWQNKLCILYKRYCICHIYQRKNPILHHGQKTIPIIHIHIIIMIECWNIFIKFENILEAVNWNILLLHWFWRFSRYNISTICVGMYNIFNGSE